MNKLLFTKHMVPSKFDRQRKKENHFLLPDLRRRPMVEENCRADLSHRERGGSVSASVSVSTEGADADAQVELQCSSGT